MIFHVRGDDFFELFKSTKEKWWYYLSFKIRNQSKGFEALCGLWPQSQLKLIILGCLVPFNKQPSNNSKKSGFLWFFGYFSNYKRTQRKVQLCLTASFQLVKLTIFGIFINFCPIKNGLSGNTVSPQALCFQKPFLAFLINFCPLKM